MPAPIPNIPTITLLSSLAQAQNPCQKPVERDVNRQVLLEVAPDREALFTGDRGIDEIRHSLKIRPGAESGYVVFFFP